MLSWKTMDGLQKYNMILFIIHLILMIVFMIYFKAILKSDSSPSRINLTLYEHIFRFDSNSKTFIPRNQESFEFKESTISNLIVSFFGITAAFHLFYALNPNNLYLNAVKNGNNYFRWIEYSITATIMIVIIAILSGVKDVQNYFMLISSAFAMIWTGQWFETADKNNRFASIIVGFVLLAGAFQVILASFRARLKEAQAAGFNLPAWLWMTVIILFIFYASFGFVPIAQSTFGGDYRTYEKTYLTLSIASKASLGMLVAYGFGQRSKAENAS
jgi:hypothetical protein